MADEDDDDISRLEKELADTKRKLRDLERQGKKPDPHAELKAERDRLKLRREILELEEALRKLEHPQEHSWWERSTERLEKKTRYYEAQAKYREHAPNWGNVVFWTFVSLVALGGVVVMVFPSLMDGLTVGHAAHTTCYYYDRNFGCLGKAGNAFWTVLSAVGTVAVIGWALGWGRMFSGFSGGKKPGGDKKGSSTHH